MKPSSLTICEGLGERQLSISPTSTSLARPDAGYGLVPWTAIIHGSRRLCLTAGGATPFPASTPQSLTSVRRGNYWSCFIHIHIWTWSMETRDCSQAEAERLKRENAMLRQRIAALEAEILRLQAKAISVWGEA